MILLFLTFINISCNYNEVNSSVINPKNFQFNNKQKNQLAGQTVSFDDANKLLNNAAAKNQISESYFNIDNFIDFDKNITAQGYVVFFGKYSNNQNTFVFIPVDHNFNSINTAFNFGKNGFPPRKSLYNLINDIEYNTGQIIDYKIAKIIINHYYNNSDNNTNHIYFDRNNLINYLNSLKNNGHVLFSVHTAFYDNNNKTVLFAPTIFKNRNIEQCFNMGNNGIPPKVYLN